VTAVATLRGWSAWAPGLEDEAAWRSWAAAPVALKNTGRPDASFLPAMLRRRCNALTRIMLTAAFGCGGGDAAARYRTVFASRHGSINDSIGQLEALARRKALSPTAFSHTVHNVQAGLFSIAAGNREASSSISGQADTFASGWIEALTQLDREPGRDVLLVVGDVPLDPMFAPMVEEAAAPYGLAVRLGREGEGETLHLEVASEPPPVRRAPWPDALEFLRWLLSRDERLVLGSGPCRYAWRRA